MLEKSIQILLHMWLPLCYSCKYKLGNVTFEEEKTMMWLWQLENIHQYLKSITQYKLPCLHKLKNKSRRLIYYSSGQIIYSFQQTHSAKNYFLLLQTENQCQGINYQLLNCLFLQPIFIFLYASLVASVLSWFSLFLCIKLFLVL